MFVMTNFTLLEFVLCFSLGVYAIQAEECQLCAWHGNLLSTCFQPKRKVVA